MYVGIVMTSFSRFAAPGLIDLPQFADERGVLTSIESGLVIPFEVKRVFFISDASGNRGNHAHRFTTQLLVAVANWERATALVARFLGAST